MEQDLKRAVVCRGDKAADTRIGDVPVGERDVDVGQDVDLVGQPLRRDGKLHRLADTVQIEHPGGGVVRDDTVIWELS